VVHGMVSLEPLTVGRYVYTVGGFHFRAGGLDAAPLVVDTIRKFFRGSSGVPLRQRTG
jgi:hypothetical protein